MKLQTLPLFISLALLSAGPALSDDMPGTLPDPLEQLQVMPTNGIPVPLLPSDPNFDPSLFLLETFAQITDPAFFSGFQDQHIQGIPAEAFGGFTLEQFMELPPDVFDSFSPEQFMNLPPEVLSGINSERFALLPADVISNMTQEQITKLPRAAIEGMTRAQFDKARSGDFLSHLLAGNIGGLPPEVIESFDADDFAKLDKEQCLQMSVQDLSKLFTNLDQNNFEPDDIKGCLPFNWILNEMNGALQPPVNSAIFFDVIPKPDNLPDNLKLPEIFNMNSGLAVAGRSGNGKALDGLNDVLKKLGLEGKFAFEQPIDISSILVLAGQGQYEDVELAFIPDPRSAKYLDPEDPEVAAGFTQDPENGAFIFITEVGLRFPLLPMPIDPVKMIEALTNQGVQGQVEVRSNGVVIVPDLPEQTHPFAFVFDMLATADPGFGPGLHNNPLGDGLHWLVDANSRAQRIRPTLPNPEELENWGQVLDIKIKHQTDGSFKLLLEGLGEYTLKPTFEVETRPLAEDEEFIPGFGTDSNGKIAFLTLKDGMVMIIRLLVVDPDGNTLDL